MNRRELLASFLGASAAALTGCGNASVPALPPGELVGGSDKFGHRLRDGPRVTPSRWEDIDVLIVGGGIAGLSAAWRLKRRNTPAKFLLLELEDAAGGTSRSGTSSICAYPWGGHYLPVPQRTNTELLRLLDEIGILEGRDADGEPIVAEQYLCRDPQERIFHGGVWHEGLYLAAGASEDDLRQFRAFKQDVAQWVAWRDGRGQPAFTLPIAGCSDDAELTALDQITLAEYLAGKGYTSERLRWYINYACRDDHATTLETTSAWAGLFYFASRMPKPDEPPEPLITWPEGNGRLVNHLHQAVGGTVRTNVAVTDIFHDSDNTRVRVATIDRNENAVGYNARRVIFAAPQFVARHVIRDYRDNPPPHLAQFQYGAWMVANLFLRNRPALPKNSFPLCWDNVLYDSPSLGYVVATHQTEQDHGPTIFTYYYPFCDADAKQGRARLQTAGRDEWAEVASADLTQAHPDIRGLTERIDIMRWGHGMIQPRPNFMWRGARQKAAQPYRQIHFAHSDLSGIALFEEAFYQGLRAADEVHAAVTAANG